MSRLGIIGLGLLFATGIWLVAAPFVTGQQPGGVTWTTATRNDVIVGAVLMLLGFTGFFTALAGHIADLYARGAGPPLVSDHGADDRAGRAGVRTGE